MTRAIRCRSQTWSSDGPKGEAALRRYRRDDSLIPGPEADVPFLDRRGHEVRQRHPVPAEGASGGISCRTRSWLSSRVRLQSGSRWRHDVDDAAMHALGLVERGGPDPSSHQFGAGREAVVLEGDVALRGLATTKPPQPTY